MSLPHFFEDAHNIENFATTSKKCSHNINQQAKLPNKYLYQYIFQMPPFFQTKIPTIFIHKCLLSYNQCIAKDKPLLQNCPKFYHISKTITLLAKIKVQSQHNKQCPKNHLSSITIPFKHFHKHLVCTPKNPHTTSNS